MAAEDQLGSGEDSEVVQRGQRHRRLRQEVCTLAVFQLGLFMRALRPARTVLCPARLSSALSELFKIKIKIKFLIFFYIYKM